MRRALWIGVLLLGGCPAGDGGDGADAPLADVAPDVGTDTGAASDVAADVAGQVDAGDASEGADVPDTSPGTDAGADATPDAALQDAAPADAADDAVDAGSADVEPGDTSVDAADVPLPPLETVTPFGPPPADPLAGTALESCAVFQAERCTDGAAQTCAVWDTSAGGWVDELDPLYRRVLLYERWYDLYHQPMGITADRAFAGPTPAGTPEAEWGALEHFAWHGGVGDGPIWTGKALTAYILRYLQTGTEADYARIEEKIRKMLVLFDVTGIPGYLARYPFLHGETQPPKRDDLILRAGGLDGGDHPFDPSAIPDLPPEFHAAQVETPDGPWTATPMWHGNPSIDQYSGFTTSFTLAWDLVKDEALKERMAWHLTCYLKRLSRIEIRHLQQNEEALAAVNEFLAGGDVQLDPGDWDPLKLDTIVMYVTLQPNSYNEGKFDTTCPAEVQIAPKRVLDAAGPSFLLDLASLAQDMQTHQYKTANQIDHFYIPNVRGGDAMQLMNLATLAWRMTGDEQYREFLFEELIGNIHTLEVAHIMGAFTAPKWCNSFFGAHITYTPLWTFISQLAESDLKTHMQQVFAEEMWAKETKGRRNAEVQLMLAGTVDEALWPDRPAMLAEALAALDELGGNGGVLEDPRRSYTLLPEDAIASLPPGTTVECAPEAERQLCEKGISLFGITVEQKKISYPCTGAVTECVMEDGLCTTALASYGVPMSLRIHEDFMWQRNPFKLGTVKPVEGAEQSPGLDLIEPFWVARSYGFTDAGKGQVLAWRDTGVCE